MTNIEDLRIIFEDSLGSPGANERLPDGRYKFDYVEEEWQRFLGKQTAAAKLLAMAREAGAPNWWSGVDDANVPGRKWLVRFAALVAAKERERFALECIDLVAFHGASVEIEAAIRARGQA